MKDDFSTQGDPGFGEPRTGLNLRDAKLSVNGRRSAEYKAVILYTNSSIDIKNILTFVNACITSKPRVGYKMGAKVPDDNSQPGNPAPPGFLAVDCSGFVRAAIRRSTNPKMEAFPDGSVIQHEWIQAQGFRAGRVEDGEALDGILRIAFLPPSESKEGVGHVSFILDGQTIESHGGIGPDRRVWKGLAWRTKTTVFCLT